MNKIMVGMAAEFAVASELARRNIYAQPTFGNLKRTDLLILGKAGKLLKIEAKGKQATEWQNCKGISDNNSIMVLVDFAGKEERDRPDFYILTSDDWLEFVQEADGRHPGKNTGIGQGDAPARRRQVKNGKPYKGSGIRVGNVKQHLEKWEKISELLG